ncbi:hypothetical protein Y032_0459g1838 [Ancylostoma ceylanicum]|nr:hypothetical protein Y032_0459g1838 [Ancylostoma ceylanicum]
MFTESQIQAVCTIGFSVKCVDERNHALTYKKAGSGRCFGVVRSGIEERHKPFGELCLATRFIILICYVDPPHHFEAVVYFSARTLRISKFHDVSPLPTTWRSYRKSAPAPRKSKTKLLQDGIYETLSTQLKM